jgi:hypothetical protein
MFDDNNWVIKVVYTIILIFYFISYIIFLNNLVKNDTKGNEIDDVNKFFIMVYLVMSLILSFIIMYKYYHNFNDTVNITYKIIYSYLMFTCFLNIIGILIIYFSNEFYNEEYHKINISNNKFKYCVAIAIIFNISNTLFYLAHYYLNNYYKYSSAVIEQKLEDYTIKCFNKYFKIK